MNVVNSCGDVLGFVEPYSQRQLWAKWTVWYQTPTMGENVFLLLMCGNRAVLKRTIIKYATIWHLAVELYNYLKHLLINKYFNWLNNTILTVCLLKELASGFKKNNLIEIPLYFFLIQIGRTRTKHRTEKGLNKSTQPEFDSGKCWV